MSKMRGTAMKIVRTLGAKQVRALSSRTGETEALRTGAVFSQRGHFSAADIECYTRLTGDSNPIHRSAAAAREAGFGACVVPGMLCGSLFPALIGSRFLGQSNEQKVKEFQAGAVYLSQELKFKLPLLKGESFVAEVEVDRIVKLRQQAKVTFFTRCLRESEEARPLLLDGQAVALLPMSFIDC